MLAAGMTLGEALSLLASRTQQLALRSFFRHAAEETSKGRRLSEVLLRYGQLFPPLTLAMVQAAEQSGRLEDIFQRLAEYYEREYEVRLLLSRETFYPKLLFLAILLIPLGGHAIALALTQSTAAAVLYVLRALATWAALLALPALGLYFAYRSLLASETGRMWLDRLKLSLPLLGKLIHRAALARFSRALAVLYAAGVSMPRALELAGDATANVVLRQVAYQAARQVQEGSSLAPALAGAGLADELVLSMIRTGEQTGNLQETMDHLAGYYEDETRTAVRQLAVAIVPLAVLVAAIVVGSMVLRFYANLYGGLVGP
jgi:type IV pilus assembly protein PilC